MEITMANKLAKRITAVLFASACVFTAQVHADNFTYEVSVTNLTRGQSFTPLLLATHQHGPQIFTLGSPASDELATLAESGNTAPLSAALEATGKTAEVKTSDGLLDPGATKTVTIKANRKARHFSMAAMLIPSNDAFVSLKSVPLPKGKRGVAYYATAYDAGSEPNDELCANIPGPVCGGTGGSPGVGGEDYVHVHAGIHSNGDDVVELNAAERDWRNPVALVKIIRVHADRD
jgi:hypothetical protein